MVNSNCLPIYKWSQMILDTPPDHPIQPILAQKFFGYYLARPSPGQAGVGKKFFEGIVNSLYFGRLQTKLKSICDEAAKEENPALPIFVAFQGWAEDPTLLSPDLHLPSVSPMLQPDKLSFIIHKSEVWPILSLVFKLGSSCSNLKLSSRNILAIFHN